jgi:hypothetical protein
MTPLGWSLIMLALLPVSALAGRSLGHYFAKRHSNVSLAGQESKPHRSGVERGEPVALVVRFVDGVPQVEYQSDDIPKETIEKMLEDAQAYADGVHRETGEASS